MAESNPTFKLRIDADWLVTVNPSYDLVPILPIRAIRGDSYLAVYPMYIKREDMNALVTKHPWVVPEYGCYLRLFLEWEWDPEGGVGDYTIKGSDGSTHRMCVNDARVIGVSSFTVFVDEKERKLVLQSAN